MIVYTDGSCRHSHRTGGKGPCGAGVYIEEGQCFSMPLGITTCMAAEAGAMILGILTALDTGARCITVRSDCKTLTDQLEHPRWGRKNKDKAYRDLRQRLRELITPQIKVEWVPRNQNPEANRLARVASRATA